MKLLRYILFPIVPIYYLIAWVRNRLYDNGWKRSKSYDFPVICIGNLSTGGTGKTPMVEYLIRLLKKDVKLATLSRGYGRKSEGFQLGNGDSDAEILGDEPFQFYTKFNEDILVAVDGNRQMGIDRLLNNVLKPEVILLDDAFQHRKVKAGLNIVLTTYDSLYTKGFVLPTGNLREPKSGAKRANLIVVTKCPANLSETEKQKIIDNINPLSYQSVFFSTITYKDEVVSIDRSIAVNELPDFKLVTGIANASPLVTFFNDKKLNFEHLEFKDHHVFSSKEIENIAKSNCVVTTEKDYMRLKNELSLKGKLYYIPIQIEIDKSDEFNTAIKSFVKS